MSEQQNNSVPPKRDGEGAVAPRFGRRLLMSASLAAPTLLTLGRVAHSQTMTQNTKKTGSMGTASQLASIKARKG